MACRLSVIVSVNWCVCWLVGWGQQPIFGSIMVLYVISLGLGDEKDITVKGLEIIRKCSKVMLEMYTSILGVDKARLVCRVLLAPTL